MYSTVMVIIVAVLLAVAALALKPRQDANDLNEKKRNILASLYAGDAARMQVDAEKLIDTISYDDVVSAYVVNDRGERIDGDVFALLNDLPTAFAEGKLPVFEAKDGRVVLPVYGAGLWGPIWGYVALEKDMTTISGIIMAHKGETPGLGSEIATSKYQSKFLGKTIFEGDQFVSVKLRKGGAQDPAHEVDAVSGGTKTSDGVTAMLFDSFSHYLPLLEAKKAAAVQPAAAEEVSNDENVASNE